MQNIKRIVFYSVFIASSCLAFGENVAINSVKEAAIILDAFGTIVNEVAIAKSQATVAALKIAAEKTQRVAEFKESLLQNKTAERNFLGIPVACEKAACDLAIVAGNKRVEKIIRTFNKYAPCAVPA